MPRGSPSSRSRQKGFPCRSGILSLEGDTIALGLFNLARTIAHVCLLFSFLLVRIVLVDAFKKIVDEKFSQNGDKILLPPSAFEMLARLQVDYPMLFRLTGNGRSTHCGVLEFTAEEGCAYIPFWMMQNLLLEEGSLLTVRNVSLPKANMIKLQPQSTDFLEISNPRAVLEHALRNFSCVTVDDVLPIPFNNKVYHLQLKQVQPAPAACIIETDCNVDFEAPVGYEEPVVKKPATPPTSNGSTLGDVPSQNSSVTGPQQEPEEKKPPGIRIVDGKIIRPDEQNSDRIGMTNTQNKVEVAERVGQTGVQLNAATMEQEAPTVEYWAVQAGDGNRLDGKKAAPLKEAGTGREINIHELRAKAAEERRKKAEADAAVSALQGGKMLNGQQPAAASTQEEKKSPGIVSKRKTKVGAKFSRLKQSNVAFQGSANTFGK